MLTELFGQNVYKFQTNMSNNSVNIMASTVYMCIISSISSVEEIDMDEVKAVFETNVFGVLRVTQEVLPIMRGLKGGTLVNVSSVAGRLVTAGHGIYAASKHALEAISESLAIETSQFGVRVVLIEPGFISTTILNKADSIVIDDTVYGQHLERLLLRYKGLIVLLPFF